ncbi:MAG: DUF2339 domain-containing protein, partial [Sphingobacteriales bacterium]
YFTIALAFHQYHLISQTAAFIIMVIITGLAVALAILYDRIELAVIGAAGGFSTPFILSSGSGNYHILFIYLAILNTGLLVLSSKKKWTLINLLALGFTTIIYGAWLGNSFSQNLPVSIPLALLYAAIFYFQFLLMNIVNELRYATRFKPLDFSILLFINTAFFSVGMYLLHHEGDGRFQGLFTVLMGTINLMLAYLLFKRKVTDHRLLYLLIGLTITFISLAIPVQLKGHSITLFWSAEFVLLYWLYQKSAIRMFKYSSMIVCFLCIISLLLDWEHASTSGASSLVLLYTNLTGFFTNIFVASCFVLFAWLVSRKEEEHFLLEIGNRQVLRFAWVVAGVLLYLTAVFGVNLLLSGKTSYDVPNIYHRLITHIAILALFIYQRRKDSPQIFWTHSLLLLLSFFYYLVSDGYIRHLRDLTISGAYQPLHLLSHYIAIALQGVLFYMMIRRVMRSAIPDRRMTMQFTWAITLALVVFISKELLHLYILSFRAAGTSSELARQFNRAGLTVVWSLCSFVLIWLGMRFKYKPLRIISLSLFAISLLKLFLIDIRGISEGGKILAFIFLGVVLLIVSFMYQKLKKIIIDDKE